MTDAARQAATAEDREVYVFPASFAQERLWFLDRFEPESALFNVPAAFHIRGRLDVAALRAALSDLVERHEALRTTFAMEDGELRQLVADPEPQPLQVVEMANLPPERRLRAVQRRARREALDPFHLGRGPLFRATLARLGDDEHALFLTLHHIIADGWSLRVLYRELETLYDARRSGADAALPPLPIQYADYAMWQRDHLRGAVLRDKVEHWRQRLEGAPELLELPADHPRPSVRSHAGGTARRSLPTAYGESLADLAGDERATAFMVLMAAFLAVLHHHTQRHDLVVGTAVANRDRRELELLIGFFVNTLPLRTSLAGDPTFRQLIGRVRETALDAFAHQDLPFERLVEELAPKRTPSHTPLIQVMFLFEEEQEGSLYLPEVDLRPVHVGTGTAKYDLAFAVVHREGRFSVRADYSADLFDRTTVERLLGAYRTLLGCALDDPDRHLSALPVLSAAQRHQVLLGWNDTAGPFPTDQRLHHGFEERAREAPDALAVVTTDGAVTYGELDAAADRLAHHLRRLGVGPNVLVGIHLQRTPRMIEAVLAVHKAGGAYVPLETAWPAARIRWIVDSQGIGVVVAQRDTLASLAELDGVTARLAVVDGSGDDVGAAALALPVGLTASAPPAAAVDGPPAAAGAGTGAGAEDLAYVIFTSGSTGRPKGVMVRHRPAVNLVHWVNRRFAVGPGDRLLFVTSLAFDLSVYDVFGTLAAGATVRLADDDELADPQRLVRILRDEPITFWDSAPAALQQCVPYLPQVDGGGSDLRLVFLSGDWIPLALPDQVRGAFPTARVVSLGGATEATVWSNWYPVDEVEDGWSSIPYGRPITNARYHVLDRRLEPCPVGVPGDLYIAGGVLSTGYAGNPRQTALQYLPDPFAGEGGETGEAVSRLYRTGDRARYRPDGDLEFLGRSDHQVKLRGYRIELGEIEAVLGEHPGVQDAVVLVREDAPGHRRLVAYVIAEDPAAPPAESELRELAEGRLPAYMLPAAFVYRRGWPLSATGKLDVKALPSPEAAAEEEPRSAEAAAKGQADAGATDDADGGSDGGVALDGLAIVAMAWLDRQGGGDDGSATAVHGQAAGGAAGVTAPGVTAPGVTAPATGAASAAAEELVAAAWAAVLDLDEVPRHGSFFDLGGNSLLMTQVHVRLQQAFQRDIPMVTLFRHPSVAELAAHLAPADQHEAAVAREEAPRPGVHAGPVAVVGMAGRFPGAPDVEAFWRLLDDGREGIRFFSDDELLAAGVDPERLADPSYVRGRGALDDPELFDAEFFALSPRQAQVLDPQQRLLLETAWAALEDAGHAPAQGGAAAAPRIAVYAGVSYNEYARELSDRPEVLAAVGRFGIRLGNQLDYAATRLSYKLGLTGPAMTVQTACSTSLVAVHLACRALAAGECDLALVGGASVQAREVSGYPTLDGGIDSPDGHTRAFDAAAAGSVAGSGVATVVLRRLDDAVADGDTVRAVLLGSALNNDGSRKVGFTAPSADGQAAVIRAAQSAAGVEPASIGYVETHGTGTPMGDPIEIAGLKQAWSDGGGAEAGSCLLGSVKSNVGHLDAAAGVTGLIKAILALQRNRIPPSLHFETPNPQLAIEGSPFRVAARREEWPAGPTPRRAGVSSFGIGGTNAHLVLEEAPPPADGGNADRVEPPPRPVQLLRLSARTAAALDAASERLAAHLRRRGDTGRGDAARGDAARGDAATDGAYLADVAHTLAVGRRAFRHRRAVVARGTGDAAARLDGETAGRRLDGTAAETAPPLVFLFPGQGAQYPGMGGDLYAEEPVFRDAVERCTELLEPHLGFDLRGVLYPPAGEEEAAAERMTRTEVAQPALFTVEHALAELLASWGLEAAAMLGHSIGEYVAATRCGVFRLADALALVAERGRLMGSLPAGDMLTVGLPEAQVVRHLARHPELSLAALNETASAVVSGPPAAVQRLADELAGDGVELHRLHTSHAFHSAMMEPILEPFAARVEAARPAAPRTPFVSNLTGTWITADQATDPDYWADHLRSPVRFAEGLDALLADGPRALLEVGPGRALSTFARRHPRRGEALTVARTLPHPKEDAGDLDLLLEAVGRLWTVGVEVEHESFQTGRSRRRVPLPTYPFQRRRFWFDGIEAAPVAAAAVDGASADSGPRSETESAVAEVWADLLGLGGVGRHDDFFDLGGSSLAGVTLAAHLGRRLDVQLPASFLLEAPTVAEQAVLIDARSGGGGAPASCLVRLQKGSAGPPLFLVHQVGGHVFTFRALGRELGADQPLFGLRSRGLEAEEEPFATIPQMADHYLGLLRGERPRGPHLLGGASMGGMVAWEMARRLCEDGDPPALLVLMDSPCGDQMPPREANAEPLTFVLRQHAGVELASLDGDGDDLDPAALRELPFDERWARVRRALAAARPELADADLAEAQRQARVLEHNVDALYAYEPRPLPLRMLFFRAAERRSGDPPRPELPWIELAAAGCETVVVPGDHESMHESPRVAALAAALRGRLALSTDPRCRRLLAAGGG